MEELEAYRCSRCRESKPRTAFAKSSRMKYGIQGWCRECFRAHHQATVGMVPDVKTCSRCSKKLPASAFRRSRGRIQGLDSACKECLGSPEELLRRRLWLYNITLDRFQEMLIDQNMACLICERKFETRTDVKIDHSHACCPGERSCGRCVRGALCDLCNRGLGYFSDNARTLDAAAKYLRQWRP